MGVTKTRYTSKAYRQYLEDREKQIERVAPVFLLEQMVMHSIGDDGIGHISPQLCAYVQLPEVRRYSRHVRTYPVETEVIAFATKYASTVYPVSNPGISTQDLKPTVHTVTVKFDFPDNSIGE